MKDNKNIDLALLLIRVSLGLVFLAHGSSKFSDMDSAIAFFGGIDLSPFWAYLVATVEVVGALLMLVGTFTGWTGIVLAIDMLAAAFLAKASHGFLGGYEFELTLFLSALAISLAGPGSYKLKYVLREK